MLTICFSDNANEKWVVVMEMVMRMVMETAVDVAGKPKDIALLLEIMRK